MPWELLNADDLVLIVDNLKNMMEKFRRLRTGEEFQSLRINARRTKVMTVPSVED